MSALLLRVIVWTTVPVAALFALLAEPAVALIYGAKWSAVVPLLPWAMLAGALGALHLTLHRLLLAHSQVRACLIGDLLWLLGIAASLALLLPSGLAAYMGGLCGIQTVVILFLIERLRRAGGLNLAGLALAVGPAVIAITLAVAVTWEGFMALGLSKDTTAGAGLFGLVTLAVYVVGLRLFFAHQMDEMLIYLPGFTLARRFLMLARVS